MPRRDVWNAAKLQMECAETLDATMRVLNQLHAAGRLKCVKKLPKEDSNKRDTYFVTVKREDES
jgi:hypothetical protein